MVQQQSKEFSWSKASNAGWCGGPARYSPPPPTQSQEKVQNCSKTDANANSTYQQVKSCLQPVIPPYQAFSPLHPAWTCTFLTIPLHLKLKTLVCSVRLHQPLKNSKTYNCFIIVSCAFPCAYFSPKVPWNKDANEIKPASDLKGRSADSFVFTPRVGWHAWDRI